VGASGAIYAIRRNLFKEIPDDIILDDVLIPMQIVRQGYRVVYQPAARA
jgi:poly-beta-1,6-N-acetyl-D-glucosamine synthase